MKETSLKLSAIYDLGFFRQSSHLLVFTNKCGLMKSKKDCDDEDSRQPSNGFLTLWCVFPTNPWGSDHSSLVGTVLRQSKKSKKKKSSGCCWERLDSLDLERAGVGFPQYQPDWIGRSIHATDIAVHKGAMTAMIWCWKKQPKLEHSAPGFCLVGGLALSIHSWTLAYRGRIIQRGSGTVSIEAPQGVWYRDGQSATFLRNEPRMKLPGSTGGKSTVSFQHFPADVK